MCNNSICRLKKNYRYKLLWLEANDPVIIDVLYYLRIGLSFYITKLHECCFKFYNRLNWVTRHRITICTTLAPLRNLSIIQCKISIVTFNVSWPDKCLPLSFLHLVYFTSLVKIKTRKKDKWNVNILTIRSVFWGCIRQFFENIRCTGCNKNSKWINKFQTYIYWCKIRKVRNLIILANANNISWECKQRSLAVLMFFPIEILMS